MKDIILFCQSSNDGNHYWELVFEPGDGYYIGCHFCGEPYPDHTEELKKEIRELKTLGYVTDYFIDGKQVKEEEYRIWLENLKKENKRIPFLEAMIESQNILVDKWSENFGGLADKFEELKKENAEFKIEIEKLKDELWEECMGEDI